MCGFKLLIEVFEPVSYRACATASMREAANGEDLVRQVRRECGLRIDIISGKTEAELIYSNQLIQTNARTNVCTRTHACTHVFTY